MKSIGLINVLVYMVLVKVSCFADTNKTEYFDVEGEGRLGFVVQNNDVASNNINAATGGSLGIKTKEINGIELGAKFYTSQMLRSKDGSGSGTGLFSSQNESYSILGEAYVKAGLKKTDFKIGRQRLDTPYANDNDIRMIPNVFEAAYLESKDIANTTLLAIHLTRAAGVDSPVPEKFTSIVSGEYGATILAVKYDGIANSNVSVWYNNVYGLTSIVHVEGYNSIKFNDDTVLKLGLQYINYQEQDNSGTDGVVYGASAKFKTSTINLYAGYNQTSSEDGKSISNVFGGGRPYMTSMDTLTLNGLSNVKAYRLGLGYNLLSNFNISYYYGGFNYEPDIDGKYVEQDIYVTYKLDDNLNAVVIYTDTQHERLNIAQDNSYKRVRGTLKFIF